MRAKMSFNCKLKILLFLNIGTLLYILMMHTVHFIDPDWLQNTERAGALEPVPQVPQPRDQCWKQNL